MKKRVFGVCAGLLTLLVTVLLLRTGEVSVKAATQDGFVYTSGYGGITITGYSGSATDVVIPSEIDGVPVITIGKAAFSNSRLCPNRKNIVSITMPTTVTIIETEAFAQCSSLERVIGTDNVVSYGTGAFRQCSSLKSFHFSDNTQVVGDNAFLMSGIETLYISKNVKRFSTNLVKDCKDLKEITIENPNIIFGNNLDGSVGTVNIPDGVVIKGPAGSAVQTWAQSKGLSFVGASSCSHDWKFDHIEVAATCTRAGQEVQRCKNCGQEQTVSLPMTAHKYGDFVIDRHPTATQNGEKSRYCSVCGARTDVTVLIKTDSGSVQESQSPTQGSTSGSGSNESQQGSTSGSGSSGNQQGGSSGNGSSGNQQGGSSGNGNSGSQQGGNSGNGNSGSQQGGSSGNGSSQNQQGGSSGNGNSGNQGGNSENNGNGGENQNPNGDNVTNADGNNISALSPDLVIKQVKTAKAIPVAVIAGVVVVIVGAGLFMYKRQK